VSVNSSASQRANFGTSVVCPFKSFRFPTFSLPLAPRLVICAQGFVYDRMEDEHFKLVNQSEILQEKADVLLFYLTGVALIGNTSHKKKGERQDEKQ
jgi:hypothetical protein